MTCIIGYIDRKNKKTYIGADSCASNSHTKRTLAKAFKMFKPETNPNIIIGISGSVRPFQILKYNVQFPSEDELTFGKETFDEKYIINKLIPKIQTAIIDGKCGDNGKDMDWSTFMIAYKDRLYVLEDNLGVIESKDYKAIGSGEYHAEGSLFALKNNEDISVVEKIHIGLKSASNFALGVENPFYIMNTSNDEILEYKD